MAEDRVASIYPLRRVDRSKYSDPDMPEYPGFIFLNHLGWRTAHVGAVLGCAVVAPITWLRAGRKDTLIRTVMPRVAGPLMAFGYVAGVAGGYALAVADKSPKNNGWSNDTVDDRAYRVVKNEALQTSNNFAAAGMVGSAVASSVSLGSLALGASAGTAAWLFAYAAVPTFRTKHWPTIKPTIVDAMTSAGIDPSSLTTGGTPAKKK
eukprot:CAMPEP_0181301928 /NCGR_PEP_ID=MMETSP1101-20121128/7692_1 /TAXON_ID=46948 /ORGANISM="Rhodomonas abbreviata, Strain Caron Lab Isolate" /LENGTH=206 /DNA_ID=CAMNT_0023407279 /DNA_START=10 /DNA_END=630 /DNA_ORIENTATION=+